MFSTCNILYTYKLADFYLTTFKMNTNYLHTYFFELFNTMC